MKVISSEMSGTLILVAVISSIFTPMVFKKLFPIETIINKKMRVVFIGATRLSLQVYRGLQSSYMKPLCIIRSRKKQMITNCGFLFGIIEIDDYSIETLALTETFSMLRWL